VTEAAGFPTPSERLFFFVFSPFMPLLSFPARFVPQKFFFLLSTTALDKSLLLFFSPFPPQTKSARFRLELNAPRSFIYRVLAFPALPLPRYPVFFLVDFQGMPRRFFPCSAFATLPQKLLLVQFPFGI